MHHIQEHISAAVKPLVLWVGTTLTYSIAMNTHEIIHTSVYIIVSAFAVASYVSNIRKNKRGK